MNPYELLLKNPAEEWENTTPVGNGRLGVSVFGRTDAELLQFNEECFWDQTSYDVKKGGEGFADVLAKLREMLLTPVTPDTDPALVDADAYAIKALDGRFYRLQSYESAGELELKFQSQGEVTDYRRGLDMLNGKADISYRRGETLVREEVFASCDPSLIAVRFTAENGTLDFDLTYSRPVREVNQPDEWMVQQRADAKMLPYETSVRDNRLIASAKTLSGTHAMQMLVELHTDGENKAITDGFAVRGAKCCVLYIAIVTDGEAVLPEMLSEADFDRLYAKNSARFSEIMGRSKLEFAAADEPELPVNERIIRMQQTGELDPQLLSIYYTFGRYLLLSSSYGKDTMPANLQGVWNPYCKAPWNSNYTININLQMNYWPAEVTNLSECTAPLFRYLTERLLPNGKEVAQEFYHCRGMVAHHISDIYGFALPGDGVWGLWPLGGAWLAYPMWEHYLFTKDETFLRETAYPYIKECAQFFLDDLFEHPRYPGRLLSGPSSSPENAYYRMPGGKERFVSHICISPAMDIEIIGGLFDMYEQSAAILGVDAEMAKAVHDAHARLMPLQIGSDGRLLEWIEEYEEFEPGHRHISHAFGLYPGFMINENTPDYYDAIRKVLKKRLANGGGHTGWSCAWLICLYARLHDPVGAEDMLCKLFTHSTKPNLFDSHPPFQIDGNFGAAAGIAEMLLQSHTGRIVLLPALPESLQTGAFTGLMARGGLEVSAAFADGRVTKLKLHAKCAGEFVLAVNGGELSVTMAQGEEKELIF